jgi:hypothetical protein
LRGGRVDGEALRGLAGADCGSECRSPGSAAGFRDPASQQQLHRHPPRRSGHQGERLVDCIDCKSGACLIFPCPVHMARHAFQMLYAKFDCVCNFKAPGRGGGGEGEADEWYASRETVAFAGAGGGTLYT